MLRFWTWVFTITSFGLPFEAEASCKNSFKGSGPVQYQLKKWASDRGYRVLENRNKSGRIDIILIAETHQDKAMVRGQIELLSKVGSSKVIHEMAGGYRFNPKTGEFHWQKGRAQNREDIENGHSVPVAIVEYAKKKGIEIIGADLTSAEFAELGKRLAKEHPETYEWDYEFGILTKRGDPSFFFTPQAQEALPYRDNKMTEISVSEIDPAQGPLVVVLGTSHSNGIHTAKLLEEQGIGYVLIDQTRSN